MLSKIHAEAWEHLRHIEVVGGENTDTKHLHVQFVFDGDESIQHQVSKAIRPMVRELEGHDCVWFKRLGAAGESWCVVQSEGRCMRTSIEYCGLVQGVRVTIDCVVGVRA